MMIKCIESIKDYGIFSNFVRNNTKDFGKHNIIFGWNYSGKTTLSRIFRSLEKKEPHPDFVNGKFKIRIDDREGSTITENDISINSLEIRVFNTDYINDNLRFEETKEGIPPILIIGEKSGKLQDELKDLNDIKEKKEKAKVTVEKRKEEKNKALQDLITDEARRITEELTLGRNFKRPNLGKLLEDKDIEKWLISNDKFQKMKITFQSSSELNPVSSIDIEIDDSIFNITRTLLFKTVTPTKTIERLKQDAELENWVREGRILHKDRQKCEFCGNDLTSNLLHDFDAHFSKGYEDFRKEVEEHLKLLNKTKLEPNLKTKNDFYPEFQEDYLTKKKELEDEIIKYNTSIEKLSKEVEDKITRLTEKMILDESIILNTENIRKKIIELNEIIKRNEQKTVSFDSIRQETKEALKRHYASRFFKSNDILKRKDVIKKLESKIEELSEEIEKITDGIENIEKQISELVKGADFLNQFIECYFGRESQIEVKVENNRFYLYRGDKRAKNLSEGEKTAISFSYFLTQLNDKDTKDNLSRAIVYVDDPISSLDNNHIFNTFALIANNLKDSCEQLFISTHNYAFFNLLKDEFRGRGKTKGCDFENRKNDSCKAPLYKIERNSMNAVLKNLDCLLCNFKSEYQYIFSKIYQFYHTADANDEYKLYTMPNLLRRFLETYLGFNYPSEKNFRKNLNRLIVNKNKMNFVHRIINEFSHSQNFERAFKMYETDEIKQAVEIVFESFKQSEITKKHLDELVKSAGVIDTCVIEENTVEVS